MKVRLLLLTLLFAPLLCLIADEPPGPREETTCGFCWNSTPVYCSSATHWLVGVSALGDSIELEDGSVWKISNGYGSFDIWNWRAGDVLTITQNQSWFSRYEYQIVNRTAGLYTVANLFLGPIQNGEYTRYIIAIDPIREELMLSDNTHWSASAYDRSIFRKWAVNDAVIVGTNSGWDYSCESLLINVNMNNSVRTKQF